MTDETFEQVARTYGDMLYRVAYHALRARARLRRTLSEEEEGNDDVRPQRVP